MSAIITPERPDTADATMLIMELEAVLDPLYPRESRHGFSIEKLLEEAVPFFLLRSDGSPAGCSGIKLFGPADGTAYGELKRMYVRPQFRGRGFGKLLIDYLSAYAREQGISLLRLETGIYQPEAIGLYERMGFYQIPPFGNYKVDPLSLCYEKQLR